jgi:hypothetical protein
MAEFEDKVVRMRNGVEGANLTPAGSSLALWAWTLSTGVVRLEVKSAFAADSHW